MNNVGIRPVCDGSFIVNITSDDARMRAVWLLRAIADKLEQGTTLTSGGILFDQNNGVLTLHSDMSIPWE